MISNNIFFIGISKDDLQREIANYMERTYPDELELIQNAMLEAAKNGYDCVTVNINGNDCMTDIEYREKYMKFDFYFRYKGFNTERIMPSMKIYWNLDS